MSLTQTPTVAYPTMDPRQIVVKRDTRQRQENIADVSDIKPSIREIGIINPITVRQGTQEEGLSGKTVLVAGERRLIAALELELLSVPYRDFAHLTPEEAEELELEENSKRKDLSWRDQVRSTARLHALYARRTPNWSREQTAQRLSISVSYLGKILYVYDGLSTGRIDRAENIEQAYNTLHRFAERKAESIVGDIIARGTELFSQDLNGTPIISEEFTTIKAAAIAPDTSTSAEALLDTQTPQAQVSIPKPIPVLPSDPIICANFSEWIKTYSGPKFTLIHCDFPYGNYRGGDSQGALGALETEDFYDNDEGVYWNLLKALTDDLDRVMSYSAHLLFWFNMNFYTRTVSELRKTGLMVHDHPLIWSKAEGGGGGRGVVPGNAVTYPRRMYDTALLAVRGGRPLAKPGDNRYHAPMVNTSNKIHPSQKPEPMLRHFFSMLVDETTTMLDPTCGSGAALRAAEDLGARSILGLELDPNYAESANTKTLQARVLRQAGQTRRED